MSVSVEREGDQIVLTAPMITKEKAKEVAGARYDSKTRTWRYPLSWAHCVMLRGVFGQSLEVGPRLATWAGDQIADRVQPTLDLRERR